MKSSYVLLRNFSSASQIIDSNIPRIRDVERKNKEDFRAGVCILFVRSSSSKKSVKFSKDQSQWSTPNISEFHSL